MLDPWLLLLEVTNRCNAHPPCVYCGLRYSQRKPQDMDFELYKRIIDSCPSSEEVHPQSLGEPLLYPHIVEAIAYARRKGKRVLIYTNASLLNESIAKQILDAGLNEIRFSVDGCDKGSYEALRPGLPWDTVRANIENFQRLKNQGGYPTHTLVRICVTKENKPRIGDIVSFWSRYVDQVAAIEEVYVPFTSELVGRKRASGRLIKCDKPFRHLTVRSNGALVLCCQDEGVYTVANLNESDVLRAFNNEEFKRIRDAIRESRNYPFICHTCGHETRRGS